ncbi:hypothetical protein QEO94_01245 [Kingella negevensis]|uniref:hypothetical protein n=1 Tax=Kingella negevensis TaxID=1522312 RepID=UPI002542FC87|nr:hypothetical protein [Kingella negevensis]WII93505.1 hypothetical protein QEO94_01245 [Kingella negevensis]
MGYRVGYQCVETQLMADDLILSKQSPILTQDGQLLRPVRVNDGWYYQNQKVKLSYPTCDPMQQFQSGALIGGAILLVIVTAYGFKLVTGFISKSLSVQGSEE